MPVVRDVVEAWRADLPGEVVTPPVTWDGEAYVLCAARQGHWLVGVDVARGRVRGKKMLPKAPARPLHVWGGVVYLLKSGDEMGGLKRVGDTFIDRWTFPCESPQGLTVLENEIYVICGGDLVRAAPEAGRPVWTARADLRGVPAVYGDTVLAVDLDDGKMELKAFDRRSGVPRSSTFAGMSGGISGGGEEAGITVARSQILVRTPAPILLEGRGKATFAFFPCSLGGDGLQVGEATGCLDLRVAPAVYKTGLLVCEKEGEWQWWHPDKGQLLASREWTRDLFDQVLPPTVLGDVVYFGTWAADAENGDILWRLPLRARFGAVPADRLVLVVAEDGTLRAYKARVG
jgi:hypothetical protein